MFLEVGLFFSMIPFIESKNPTLNATLRKFYNFIEWKAFPNDTLYLSTLILGISKYLIFLEVIYMFSICFKSSWKVRDLLRSSRATQLSQ